MSIVKYLHVECQWHCSVLGCLLAENMKMWMAQDCFPWRLLTLGLMHNVENSIILQTSLAGSIINQKLLVFLLFLNFLYTFDFLEVRTFSYFPCLCPCLPTPQLHWASVSLA